MFKKKKSYSPIVIFIFLSFVTILLSGFLHLLNVQSEYSTVNKVNYTLVNNVIEVKNLFGTSGIKNIVSSTVSEFVNFTPLAYILIILIGIGVLEKTGFLKTIFTIITKYTAKNTVTFLLIFISLFFSICGDISFVVMLPLGALLFKYGRRNPLGGIIATFAALSFGSGLHFLLSSTSANLLTLTTNAARIMDGKYEIGIFFSLFIMILIMIAISIAFTSITEKKIMPRLSKVENPEEVVITNKELRGLIIGLGAGLLFVLIVAYMIIPGLPFSGGLLDADEVLYINKLFGLDSLFNKGFIFILVILFMIIGLGYGLMAKTIRSTKDFVDCMGHSLDGIGSIIVLIFFASIFKNVFEQSNIGYVITAYISTLIGKLNLTGGLLIFIIMLLIAIANFFCTNPVTKWSMISATMIPLLMNASISPEFGQVMFTVADSITNGITPLFIFFVIYLALLDKYNTNDDIITMKTSIKYMMPYFLTVTVICFVIVIGWYMLGVPIGIGSSPGVSYGA